VDPVTDDLEILLPDLLARIPDPSEEVVRSAGLMLQQLTRESNGPVTKRNRHFDRALLKRSSPSRKSGPSIRSAILFAGVVALAVAAVVVPLEARNGSSGALGHSVPPGSWKKFLPSDVSAPKQIQAFDCLNLNWCVIEGGSFNNVHELYLWNRPSLVIMPIQSEISWMSVLSISCTSQRFCAAVGMSGSSPDEETGRDPVALIWNGAAWDSQSDVKAPTSGGNAALSSVSCTNSTSCVAVGEDANGSLVGVWNGIVWKYSTNYLDGAVGAWKVELAGVNCFSSSYCIAVGSEYSKERQGEGAPPEIPIAESYTDGRWALLPNQYRLPPQGSSGIVKTAVGSSSLSAGVATSFSDSFVSLSSVGCINSVSCVAVGESWEPTSNLFAERWDGASWSVLPSPGSKDSAQLDGVSCVTATFCMAVGEDADPSSGSPSSATDAAALAWNGYRWIGLASPANHGIEGFSLEQTQCLSTRACIAVAEQNGPDGSLNDAVYKLVIWRP